MLDSVIGKVVLFRIGVRWRIRMFGTPPGFERCFGVLNMVQTLAQAREAVSGYGGRGRFLLIDGREGLHQGCNFCFQCGNQGLHPPVRQGFMFRCIHLRFLPGDGP